LIKYKGGHTHLNRDTTIVENIKESGYEMTQLKYKHGWVYEDPTIIIALLNPRGNATIELLIIRRHMILIWLSDKEVLKRGVST
jgi:hypothetical protein